MASATSMMKILGIVIVVPYLVVRGGWELLKEIGATCVEIWQS